MAVIEGRPGLEVTIISGGEALYEYDDNEAKTTAQTVTKFVEIGDDDNFEVLIKFNDDNTAHYGVRHEVRLDGVKVHSGLCRLKDLTKSSGHRVSGVKSKINGRWHTSNFLFSAFGIGNMPELMRT